MIKKYGYLALFLVMLVGPLQGAEESITVELKFTPNLKNGAQVYEICASCHLPDGWGSKDGVYPQLAGQHATVLMRQLLQIRSGERYNPIMYPFVQERAIGGYQNLADVVAYVAALPMPPTHGVGPWSEGSNEWTQGKQLYNQRCAGCHGKQGQGDNEKKISRLYGQHYAYLQRAIRELIGPERSINEGMYVVVQDLKPLQIETILNYISYLPVPKRVADGQ